MTQFYTVLLSFQQPEKGANISCKFFAIVIKYCILLSREIYLFWLSWVIEMLDRLLIDFLSKNKHSIFPGLIPENKSVCVV